jgi:hypothetical protein
MISVLASSAVDFGFKPRSGQTKDYKIGICCFSAKHAAKEKDQRLVGSECNITLDLKLNLQEYIELRLTMVVE